jgi:DNA uptake protein ComE-like DNA-binding protein
MSIMVDHRSQAGAVALSQAGQGSGLVLMVRARLVLAAAAVLAALPFGFSRAIDEIGPDPTVANALELRLDPNKVPPEVLTALPHVGTSLVDRWVKAREEHPFRTEADAQARVRGLGSATFEQISPYFKFPVGEQLSLREPARLKTERPPPKPRTARRQKSAPAKAVAEEQTQLAALSSPIGER